MGLFSKLFGNKKNNNTNNNTSYNNYSPQKQAYTSNSASTPKVNLGKEESL